MTEPLTIFGIPSEPIDLSTKRDGSLVAFVASIRLVTVVVTEDAIGAEVEIFTGPVEWSINGSFDDSAAHLEDSAYGFATKELARDWAEQTVRELLTVALRECK